MAGFNKTFIKNNPKQSLISDLFIMLKRFALLLFINPPLMVQLYPIFLLLLNPCSTFTLVSNML